MLQVTTPANFRPEFDFGVIQSDKIRLKQDNGGTAGVLRDSGFSFFVPII